MKIIDLPQLRQTYGYDCGALALQCILVYYGIEVREDNIMKLAQTTEKNGTSPNGIINAAKKFGLYCTAKEHMTIHDIKTYIDKEIPVIIVLQARTNAQNVDREKDREDGHYVVAIGYEDNKIIFEDPSSFERTFLYYNELKKRRHDVEENGKKPERQRKKIVHMD